MEIPNRFAKNILGKLAHQNRFSLLLVAFIVGTGGVYMTLGSFAATQTCDLNATTANFSTQVNAATSGQTICLAAGDYGTWQGANKSGAGITIRPADGAAVTMALNFNCGGGACTTKKVNGITIDGTGGGPASGVSGPSTANGVGAMPGPAPAMTITDITIQGRGDGQYTTAVANQPTNVTIRNTSVTGWVTYTGLGEGAGAVNNILDHNDIDNNIAYNGANNARIRLNYSGEASFGMSGLTIQYNKIGNSDADGVHTGTAFKVIGNEIYNICPGSSGNHPDHIQFEAANARGTIVAGNYLHANCDTQGITSFDYHIDGAVIENNVVNIDRNGNQQIEIYHSVDVTIRHNTVLDSGGGTSTILVRDNPAHAGYQATTNIQVYDNVATVDNQLTNSAALTKNDHNFVTASQTFTGGAAPTSFAGFALTAGSPGHLAASDGKDAGADISSAGAVTPPSSDTTPPTVSITAPANATTQNGTVSITASAADDVAVSRVEFYVDGALAGSDSTSPYSYSWDSTLVSNGSHSLQAKAYDTSNNSTASATRSVTTNNTALCSLTSSSWQNQSLTAQTGTFSFDYDATPTASTIDSVTGLSSGTAAGFADLATIVRFNASGSIDARNGGAYASDVATTYTADMSYHFKLTVNVPAHTYSVIVTPTGGNPIALATNYAFRTEQAGISSVNNWATNSVSGSHKMCGVVVNAITDTTAPTTPTGLSASTDPLTATTATTITLTWNSSTDTGGSGLAGYKLYRAGSLVATIPSGTTSFTDPNLTPATSYAYTVAAYDTAGNTSVQSSPASSLTTSSMIGDLDADGHVTGHDLSILLSHYNTHYPRAEFDGFPLVQAHNLSLLLGNFGR